MSCILYVKIFLMFSQKKDSGSNSQPKVQEKDYEKHDDVEILWSEEEIDPRMNFPNKTFGI